MRLPPVYADGLTKDSRLMAFGFFQSILTASLLKGLWKGHVFNLAPNIGPSGLKKKKNLPDSFFFFLFSNDTIVEPKNH